MLWPSWISLYCDIHEKPIDLNLFHKGAIVVKIELDEPQVATIQYPDERKPGVPIISLPMEHIRRDLSASSSHQSY